MLALCSANVSAQSRIASKAEIELIRDGMQGRLKDADSAKFRNVRIGTTSHKDTICGDVNAKNSFGAYSGFVSFMGSYLGPDAYTDSATVKRKPTVLILRVDESAGGAVAQVCEELGI